MRRVLTGVATLLAVSFPHVIAQQLPEDPALKEQIRKLDLAHAEAIFKGDKAALQELLPDDHVVNHPTNRIVQEKAALKLIDAGVIDGSGSESLTQRVERLWGPALVWRPPSLSHYAPMAQKHETMQARPMSGKDAALSREGRPGLPGMRCPPLPACCVSTGM